jgi:hypothetical protein
MVKMKCITKIKIKIEYLVKETLIKSMAMEDIRKDIRMLIQIGIIKIEIGVSKVKVLIQLGTMSVRLRGQLYSMVALIIKRAQHLITIVHKEEEIPQNKNKVPHLTLTHTELKLVLYIRRLNI